MRMPVDVLLPWLGPMQEGMLLWAEDSKNKFKLKVRAVLERLVRRCGAEAVAAATPAGDVRLLAHIRKQRARKERQRSGSMAGSQVSSGGRGGGMVGCMDGGVKRCRSSKAC